MADDGDLKPKLTVADLVKLLQELPQDAVVVLAKDEEGNHFSPLSDVDGVIQGYYAPETTWYGEFKDDESYADPDTYGILEDPNYQAVCLWPVN